MKQTLLFLKSGQVEFMLNEQSSFQLRGKKTIKRVSDVLFSGEQQFWYIKWLLGPHKYCIHNHLIMQEYGVSKPDNCKLWYGITYKVLIFQTKQDAVAHEIEMYNAMKKAGVMFDE